MEASSATAAAAEALAALANVPDARSRTAGTIALLDSLVAAADGAALRCALDALVDEAVPLAVARPALRHAGEALARLSDDALLEAVVQHGLAAIARRGVELFEEADYALRLALFQVCHAHDDFLGAATVLGAARLDGAAFTDHHRAAAWIKVAQAFYKAGDDVGTERFLRRAGDVVHRAGDATLQLQYAALYATSLDAKRSFLPAAQRYLEVLNTAGGRADERSAVELLEKAAVCGVLASAGAARTRVLAALAADARLPHVRAEVAAMLQRVLHQRPVPPSDVAAFEAGLAVHQRATGADGSSVVARAMTEHNTFAASRLYASLSFDALGALLGVPRDVAERTAARMVAEQRLPGASLDQVDGFVDFDGGDGGGGGGGGAELAGAAGARRGWDASIRELCGRLASASDAIVAAHPALAPT